jgi:hypothetical protein
MRAYSISSIAAGVEADGIGLRPAGKFLEHAADRGTVGAPREEGGDFVVALGPGHAFAQQGVKAGRLLGEVAARFIPIPQCPVEAPAGFAVLPVGPLGGKQFLHPLEDAAGGGNLIEIQIVE